MSDHYQALSDFRDQASRLRAQFREAVRSIEVATLGDNPNAVVPVLVASHDSASEYFGYYDQFAQDCQELPCFKNSSWRLGFAEDCIRILDRIASYYDAIFSCLKKHGLPTNLISPEMFAFSNMERFVSIELPDNAFVLAQIFHLLGLPMTGWSKIKKGPATKSLPDAQSMIEPPLTRARIRIQMNELFITDTDLEAFFVDYFPEIWRQIPSAAERKKKVSILFQYSNIDMITSCLTAHRRLLHDSRRQA
jgi:hypothetical protein